jgi:hypothetical protein
MRFMMLMYPGPYAETQTAPDAEAMRAMGRFNEELVRAGALITLDGLHSTSKGARVRFDNGKAIVTDGPFTETKEILGGYWIIRADSKEEAVAWASRVPAPSGEMVEVRQIFEFSEFPEDFQKAAENGIVQQLVRGAK